MSIWSTVEAAMRGAGPMSARQVSAVTGMHLDVVRNALGWAAHKGKATSHKDRTSRGGMRGAPQVLYSLCPTPAQAGPGRPREEGGLARHAMLSRSPLEVAWAGAVRRSSAPALPVTSHQGGA